MNKKKGFTLVELLGVILIIALLAIILVPLLIRSMKQSRKYLSESQTKLIYSASESYIKKYKSEYPNIENNKYCITIKNLVDEGLLDEKIKNYIDDTEIDIETSIEVKVDSKMSYSYEIKYDWISCTVDMTNAPVLMIASTGGDTTKFLQTELMKKDIESIDFVNVANFPEGSVDVSEKKNGKVQLWKKDENNNGLFEVYIGAINDYVYANKNSRYLFENLRGVNKINLNNFDTSTTLNMHKMFYYTGYNNSSFALDLGNKFDTSKVADMSYMFISAGYSNSSFTLDLGNKFDTSNVTDMSYMFNTTALNSTIFSLDLGKKFDTSNVTNMAQMFYNTGRNSTKFTLNLGDKFDTSKVTGMTHMFYCLGYSSPNFTLDLGNKFDTSKVTNMAWMFYYVGRSNQQFKLDLGAKFNTSNVTDMSSMFNFTGYSSTKFSLNLGNKFNVDKVESYGSAFYGAGTNTPGFKPKATVKTQAEKDSILAKFPNIDVTITP